MTTYVGAFAGVMFLSMAFSGHFETLLMRNAWTPLILVVILILIRWAPSSFHIRLVTSIIILSVVASMLPELLAGSITRLRGIMPHSNDVALLSILAPMAFIWTFPFAILGIILSGSRNALLGLAVMTFIIVMRPWKLVLVYGCLCGALYIAITNDDPFTRGFRDRLSQWLVAVDMFQRAPTLGMGPARYIDVYIPILDTLRPLPFGTPPMHTYMPWAHNIFLEQLGERGLLGFTVFATPVVVAWRHGTINKKAALAAFLVMGFFDLTFLKPWVVGTFWALVGLEDRA